jgi:hypothetical protein
MTQKSLNLENIKKCSMIDKCLMIGDSTPIVLGDMNKSNLEYTCKVTLLKKKLKS